MPMAEYWQTRQCRRIRFGIDRYVEIRLVIIFISNHADPVASAPQEPKPSYRISNWLGSVRRHYNLAAVNKTARLPPLGQNRKTSHQHFISGFHSIADLTADAL